MLGLRRSLLSQMQMRTCSRNLNFASGKTLVFCEDAVRHGAKYETLGLTELAQAFGAPLYPPPGAASVWLDNVEVRVKPDATDATGRVLVEIKCPFTRAARKAIAERIHFHARQLFLELIAFPLATCLVFVAFDYDPAGASKHLDSTMHRLDRAWAKEAERELQERGLLQDLARDDPSVAVDAILRRMVARAIELPKVKNITPREVELLLPELFQQPRVPEQTSLPNSLAGTDCSSGV